MEDTVWCELGISEGSLNAFKKRSSYKIPRLGSAVFYGLLDRRNQDNLRISEGHNRLVLYERVIASIQHDESFRAPSPCCNAHDCYFASSGRRVSVCQHRFDLVRKRARQRG